MGDIAIFAGLGAVYLAPGLVALMRGHHNAGAIMALTVLLGWTVLGWILTLVWALTAVRADLRPAAPGGEARLAHEARMQWIGAGVSAGLVLAAFAVLALS